MDTIFTVKNEDLGRLTPMEAVGFFRELLWADARKLGVSLSKIHVSSKIDVADGGVDAIIDEGSDSVFSDIICKGHTSFQIKAKKAFKPWQPAQIKKELFGTKSPEKENLGSGIQNCLDKNGRYVLVCFKQDLTSENNRSAINELRKNFIQCGYENPNMEVWSQNNIIGFLNGFPSLALKVNQRLGVHFQTHQSWASEAEMDRTFETGDIQTSFIQNLRNELRDSIEAIHIRVLGEPGIGKTRYVLEATRQEDLSPLVIYFDNANKFRESDLMNEILKVDSIINVILVLDECDQDSRSYIWNKLKYLGPRIKLISIYSDFEMTTGNIKYLNVPPLDRGVVSNIIQSYGIPKDEANRWSEFCSGSPRVAHVIGKNLKFHPEDLLQSPDTIDVWDRYVVGMANPNSPQIEQIRLVLRIIALFKRFGHGRQFSDEAQAIASLVESVNPQITLPIFRQIIRDLKLRKIIQGEYTLYITPKLLHIKLWIDWWEINGEGFDYISFVKDLPMKLREWFFEMFQYASESRESSLIVKEILGENGPFQVDNYFMSDEGAKFFFALTNADPESALHCLEKTIGTKSKEELLAFKTGRREVVRSLEKIVMWKGLFTGATRLILALGEAENESWANNASGVFTELFKLGIGKVASTEASPAERFPILKDALESNSRERRQLALRACDLALESRFFSRVSGDEYQGMRKEPQLWIPKTKEEINEAYINVWALLLENIDEMLDSEQEQVVEILLTRSRGLGRFVDLSQLIIDSLSVLAGKPYVQKERVLATVIEILHYDGDELPQQTRQAWEELKNKLMGTDFSSRIKRYVGMDLIVDHYNGKGNRFDQSLPGIENLARQAIENPELLEPELDWLATTKSPNGFRFGYTLGKNDSGFSQLIPILNAQRRTIKDGTTIFIGGYLRSIFELDTSKWEAELNEISTDDDLCLVIPELTWYSGMTDQAALRILHLAENEVINCNQFRMFSTGSATLPISEGVFSKWIGYLMKSQVSSAVPIAMELYYFYFCHKEREDPLPEQLTISLLTHKSLFQKTALGEQNHMDFHYWKEIAKKYIQHYPVNSLELADNILKHFGQGWSMDGLRSRSEVLNIITHNYASEMWGLIIKYIGPPINGNSFYVTEWVRGGETHEINEGILPLIPLNDIWQWVDEDIDIRAPYFASFVPNSLFIDKEKICLAREVIIRYGSTENVKMNLMQNISTESWVGTASQHYHQKKQELLKFKESEENNDVKSWIDEYVAILDQDIEQAKMSEERRGY